MTIKTSARPVLILVAGLFACFASPSPVAAGVDDKAVADSKSASSESNRAAEEFAAVKKYVKRGSRHWKRHAHRKSDKVALTSSPAKKADAIDVAAADGLSTAIPPSVANANAQLVSTDTPDGNARAMSARANDILQAAADKPVDAQPAAEAPVVPPDALNEVDRTLPASDPPATATASADAPVAESSDSSSLDRTSLIGKIFMACGGLLTLASAARMFMG